MTEERRRAAGTMTTRASRGFTEEPMIGVRCSCGKLVTVPRGWAFFVKHTKDAGKGKCPCKHHGFKKMKGK